MTAPTVSIVIPTYNGANHLPRALDSVVAQTFQDWEIVVVDDGSTDATPAVAARYRSRLGARLIYLHQPNGGSSSARNLGIDRCRGRFVAFLDADDEFLPRKLERQLELFARRPDLGFVYSDYAYVDLAGVWHESALNDKCQAAWDVPFEVIAPGLCVCVGDLFDVLIRRYFIATIVGMVRRETLGESIRFATDRAYAEEWLFYLNVSRACRSGFVREPLSVHHFMPGSLARTDKHRNMLRYRDLLAAIELGFDDLNHDQRMAIASNRAQAARQIAFDASRTGRHRDAVVAMIESLRYGPTLQRGWELISASASWLIQSLASSPAAEQPLPQDAALVVR